MAGGRHCGGGGYWRHGHGTAHGGWFAGYGLETAADVPGTTPEELCQRLQDGETLAEIAEAEGVATSNLFLMLF